MNDEPTWATDVRQLARGVALELNVADSGERASDAAVGWPLWSGITRRGSTEPRGSGGAYLFSSWQYTTTLALRTDGELVTFQGIEGRTSPNDGAGAHGVLTATINALSYPDVTRWRDQREVEEAPIRLITDIYSIPEEYAEPRGAGLTMALETLRSERRTPQPLGPARPSAASATATGRRKGFLARLFS